MDTISTNVLGPALIVQKFVPLLEQAQDRGVVMNMSSGLGSLERVTIPGWAVYSVSKAAVGMLVRPVSFISPTKWSRLTKYGSLDEAASG